MTRVIAAASLSVMLVAAAAGAQQAPVAPAPGAPKAPVASSAAKRQIEHGREVYTKVGCYQCHGREGQGGSAGSRLGPDPQGYEVFSRYVRHPRGEMPPYGPKILTDDDLADIHAFLSALPQPPARLPTF